MKDLLSLEGKRALITGGNLPVDGGNSIGF